MKNAHQHNINNRSMIRYENILPFFIDGSFRLFDEFVAESHAVKKYDTPPADKDVGIFEMRFFDGKQDYRQAKNQDKQKCQKYEPGAPQIIQNFFHRNFLPQKYKNLDAEVIR